MDLLKGLSLFTGIGGIDKALEEWVEPIAYCEIEPYCQSVLLSRMQKGDLPKAPIWDDIRSLSFKCSRDKSGIDIIYGGFPCQDISIAGLGKGLEGERSGLFFEIMRLLRETRPKFLFLENVPAITSRGGLRVVKEITKMGYDCRWCVISAASVGALHKRDRWFLLAYSQSERFIQSEFQKQSRFEKGLFERGNSLLAHAPSESTDRHTEREKETHPLFGVSCNDGNAYSQPSEQADSCPESIPTIESTRGRPSGQYWPFKSRDHWQEAECSLGRTLNGFSDWVDRNKHLTINSHLSIMAYVKYELNNAKTSQENRTEILRNLQCNLSKEIHKWKTRGLQCISSKEILFSYLLKLETEPQPQNNISCKSAEIYEKLLRSMWIGEKFASSSYRREYKEQFGFKFTNPLQALSQILALDSEKAWIEYCRKNAPHIAWDNKWEEGIDRTSDGLPSQVDRLKSLGNSVVPQQVKEAFKILAGLK